MLHQHKMRSIVTRSVVCLCVCLSTCFSQVCCEPSKNGRTDRSADWVVDFGVRGTMYWMGAQIYCYCYTSTAERVYAITERQHRHKVNTVKVNEIANSVCLRAFDVARSFWNSTQARVSRARAYEHLEVILVSVLRRRSSAGKKTTGERAGRSRHSGRSVLADDDNSYPAIERRFVVQRWKGWRRWECLAARDGGPASHQTTPATV